MIPCIDSALNITILIGLVSNGIISLASWEDIAVTMLYQLTNSKRIREVSM